MFNTRKIILLMMLVITITVAAYILFVTVPTTLAERSYDGARKVGEDVRKFFQFTPEITVNNTVVLQQQTEVFELATLTQTFRHEYEWNNQWMGSTKKIRIKGTFDAKAGFDLHKKISINIDDDKATVVLPAPELLSITPRSDLTFEDEQGIWNWVNNEDRSAAVNAFTADAQRYARDADFVANARTAMEKRMTEILGAHGLRAVIVYEERLIAPR